MRNFWKKWNSKLNNKRCTYYLVNDNFHVMRIKINFYENNKKKKRIDKTLIGSDTDDFIAVRNNVYIGKINLNACSITTMNQVKLNTKLSSCGKVERITRRSITR